MKRFILGGVVTVLLLVLTVVAWAQAPLSLQEALEIAGKESPAARLSEIELEEARLAFEDVKANLILRPSVLARQQSESAWKAAEAKWGLARRDLAMQVEQAYYDVLRTQMALNLAQRFAKAAQTQLDSTRSRHALGMLSDVDLLASESQLATGQADLNRAQANLENARLQLNRILGRELGASYELADGLAREPVALDVQEALASALEKRPELERARDNLALREKELAVSDPAYTPPLTIEKLRLAVDKARLDLAQTQTSIQLEVRQSYQTVKESEARIPIQEKNLARAKESLRITEARYSAGVTSAADLLEAQRSAQQAEAQVIQATFDYSMALARFSRSAGR